MVFASGVARRGFDTQEEFSVDLISSGVRKTSSRFALAAMATCLLLGMTETASAHNGASDHQNNNHRHLCMWKSLSSVYSLETVTSYTGVYSRARSGNNLVCFGEPACSARHGCSPADDWYKRPSTHGTDPGSNPSPPYVSPPKPGEATASNPYPYNGCRPKEVRVLGTNVCRDPDYPGVTTQCPNAVDTFRVTSETTSEWTGRTVNMVVGRQDKNGPVDNERTNPDGYCNCLGSLSAFSKGGHAVCGPSDCENPLVANPDGTPGGQIKKICPPRAPVSSDQQDNNESPPYIRYYDDLVDGSDPLQTVDDDGQYSFLVESALPPIPGATRSPDRSDDWNRIVTSTQIVGLALYGNDQDGPMSCPFPVDDGHTVTFEWPDGISLTLPIEDDPVPFVSENGLRCVISIDQDVDVTYVGTPATVPEGEVRITFSPDIDG